MDKGIKLIVWYVVAAFAVLMLLVGLFSCNSAKKAAKHYNKAKAASVITVAQLARTDFPCVTTRIDTVKGKDSVIVRDTTIYQKVFADCPDTAKGAAPGKTIRVPVLVPCNCKDSIVYRPITLIKKEKDSSDIFLANKERVKAELSAAKSNAKMELWRGIALTLLGAIALFILIKAFFKF